MNPQRSNKKRILRLTAAMLSIELAVWMGYFIKNFFSGI